MKLKLLNLIFSTFTSLLIFSQTHVNREWMDVTGSPDTLAWSNSIINSNNELIHIGNTQIVGQNVKMLVTKYDNSGEVVWQNSFNHDSLYHDYGVAIGLDANNNIYIAGTSKHITDSKSMLTVVKYSNNGALQWYENYYSGGTNEDYTTGITVTSSGDVYVSGSSKNATTDFDFLAVKFNNSGVLQWDTRYDYNGLVDFTVNIALSFGKVILVGASANSADKWDYTMVILNQTNGNFIFETRDALPGFGYDVPSGFSQDNVGNYYLTGRSSTDGISYVLRTIKLDDALNIIWSRTFDGFGILDEGTSVVVDALGNVYVGGYVTRPDNVKEMIIIKYNQNGDLQWKHQQPGNDPKKDAKIIALALNANDELYYLGQESKKNGNIRPIIGKFRPDGRTIYQRYTTAHSSFDEFPKTLRIDNDDYPYFTAIVDDGNNLQYVTRKYSEFTQSTDYPNSVINSWTQSLVITLNLCHEFTSKKMEAKREGRNSSLYAGAWSIESFTRV